MNVAIIRKAVLADLAELYVLLQAKADFDGASAALTVTAVELGAALFCESPKCEFVVAVQDKRLVGFAAYYPIFSTYAGRPGLWMDYLFVDEHARGRSIGRDLLKFVAAEAAKRKCCKLEWSLLRSNTRGIAFYQREGAVVREENRFAKLDEVGINRLLAS